MKKLAPLFLLLAACAVKPVYLNRDGRSVAVLPPFNSTNYLEASAKVWPFVEQEVAARGYAVLPRETIQAFYEKNRFRVPEEIRQYENDELAKAFGCDFVLYSHVKTWDRITALVYTKLSVSIEAEMRDGKDSQIVWKGEGEAGESSTALSGRDMLGDSVEALMKGCERYAGPATANCFRKLPLCGFEPKPPSEEQPQK